MKKALFAIAMAAFAQVASATVANSPHDLSTRAAASQSSCAYCHAPHFTAGLSAAPLWNRNMSTQTFTQFTVTKNGEASMTCLSCHDGTIDLGNTLNTDDTLGVLATATALIGASGGSLDSDHPIGVSYPAAGTTTGAMLRLRTDAAGDLGNYDEAKLATLECSGCHDPHLGEATKFLRTTLDGICVACHEK